MKQSDFLPSRDFALERLKEFSIGAGRFYAAHRNIVSRSNKTITVSKLSPYVRRRLITEHEIISCILAQHDLASTEKFIEEVLWRTYWKGWLEMRPTIWARFLADRDHQREIFKDLRSLSDAEHGNTGIEGFDDWVSELKATGYLHNHVRMWFASIWIFTLRLPWSLGADFFLRNLIDADPASNTLSWRWVAGLQTPGKTYLATKENIARYTQGLFAPEGLAKEAVPLRESQIEPPRALPVATPYEAGQPALLLVTDEDMHPESLFPKQSNFRAARIIIDPIVSFGEKARHFTHAAAMKTKDQLKTIVDGPIDLMDRYDAEILASAAHAAGVKLIVTPYAPVGPVASQLSCLSLELKRRGIALTQHRREWDSFFWPHATKGFFSFRPIISLGLEQMGLI